MFKQFHVRSLFALAWLSLSAAVWADEAGKVVLSVGEVRVQGQPVKAGHSVQAGDRLSTGADGYVYIKTVDNGFLILRPNSDASIIAYQADSHTPANSRFKFELREGVARSISGQAVKNAKQNFRFNTPVAAIGVDDSILASKASLLVQQAEYRLRVHKRMLHWVFLDNDTRM